MNTPLPSAADNEPVADVVRQQNTQTLTTVTLCLVTAACGWYLLRELASLLRPLLLAVFLCYLILPAYIRLKRHIPGALAVVVLSGLSVGFLVVLSSLIYAGVIGFNEKLPGLIRRAEEMLGHARQFINARLPEWVLGQPLDADAIQEAVAGKVQTVAGSLVRVAADIFAETVIVGIYLIFFLLEAARLPNRVKESFTDSRASQILSVIEAINNSMASYLTVKIKASLLIALPVTILLFLFGVPLAALWGVLTFLFNFIPYLGSVIACTLPILMAGLQLSHGWQVAAVATLLVSVHLAMAYFVEPAMTGKAVGISPVVILASLAFWGLCWGLIGMFLAVPLTVMMKIIFENIPFTQPLAKLLGES